jgi:solute carrier family 25 phosphate transporter 23/24/25/41
MHLLIGIVQCNLVQVALSMLRDEGIASFYYGLGPSLVGIAPYIAVNFCIFDL